MLDHIGLTVTDFARSKAFYVAALAPLGITIVMELGSMETDGFESAGFGDAGKPYFWIGVDNTPSGHVHVAFAAPDHTQVDAFYRAALAAGGTDNGAPGLRPDYHPNYYAAFVLDPDGHNVEVVCHGPA